MPSQEQVEPQAARADGRRADAEVLIFTDVFGATPGRGAGLAAAAIRACASSPGVNVPMLWRTLCYGTDEPLDALVLRAVAGATQGVMQSAASPPQNQASRPSGDDQASRHDQ